jgi:dihydrofolate synthase/folylpolyglutamate synthase
LVPGLFGNKQAQNMALSVAAMDASGAGRTLRGYADGVYRATVPGRFERRSFHGAPFVLDGAHNLDAAKVLAENMREAGLAGKRIVLLTGMVAGHEPAEFYRELASLVSSAHIAPLDFHRALAPEELAPRVAASIDSVTTHKNAKDALDATIDDAALDGTVLVTGSFYLVGEIGRLMA